MLIKRVFEVDPLQCPKCGGQMKIISFIERRQRDVIERILRHCNLCGKARYAHLPMPAAPPPSSDLPDQDTKEPREVQLVLDPEYL